MMETRDGRKVSIRPVKLRDAAALNQLTRSIANEGRYLSLEPDEVWDLASESQRLAMLDLQQDCWLAAFAEPGPDGESALVGQVTAWRERRSRESHVATVGIGLASGWRGQGIGTALMQLVAEWAQAAGVQKLQLRVLSTNRDAHRLYERLGYKEEGIRLRQYLIAGEWVDEVLMARWVEAEPKPDR